VGVGAWVALDETGACREARIVLGAVAPTPIRAPAAEAALRDRRLTDGVLAEAAQQAAAASRPISDIRASAEYRRHLVGVLAKRAVRAAWMRAQGIA
ncbi:MAG: xanthine dehydrogenase family protein subunit M, partial [Anaerolineae bacterium]|nr:xanthine dehydrogenase family protein subunit M [Anaerolineae bacterium]